MPRVATSSSPSPLPADKDQMEFAAMAKMSEPRYLNHLRHLTRNNSTPGRVARQALTKVCRREGEQSVEVHNVHMLDSGRREEEKKESEDEINKKQDNSEKMKRLQNVEEKEKRPVDGEVRAQGPRGASNWRRSVARAPRK